MGGQNRGTDRIRGGVCDRVQQGRRRAGDHESGGKRVGRLRRGVRAGDPAFPVLAQIHLSRRDRRRNRGRGDGRRMADFPVRQYGHL